MKFDSGTFEKHFAIFQIEYYSIRTQKIRIFSFDYQLFYRLFFWKVGIFLIFFEVLNILIFQILWKIFDFQDPELVPQNFPDWCWLFWFQMQLTEAQRKIKLETKINQTRLYMLEVGRNKHIDLFSKKRNRSQHHWSLFEKRIFSINIKNWSFWKEIENVIESKGLKRKNREQILYSENG